MKCIIASKQKHFYDQVRIRKEVFIIEQQVPIEEEYDELDNSAIQFIVYDHETPIAAARFRIIDNKGKVERVCVLKNHRKQGVGKLIMNSIEEYAINHTNIHKLVLNAQLTALSFYKKLGFTEFGDIFLDANIEHKSMYKEINN
ncbi:MAG: acetyltransferase [Haloplasmataceae bacterium]|jgi:predicted GNAT family N-acyltransferase|nr:acetyltransferase [Haloplasmataceae bacterium]